ncbi:PTS system mannose-specific EIIBCA component [Planctomycetes bacterium Pla163]|uniref:PTS system mannose-specific EIIBCA component n=1 Tax=Rohdeia mirabilis TaxID=2528008 RepID=A0A518D129_9BACT|nr:PTS system mannose-specific EIIBCA component [Planctomycetes bacterium Pla163]
MPSLSLVALSGPLLGQLEPLLVLGIVLAVGAVFGILAKKIHLPSVTGQILAGFVVGTYGIGLVDSKAVLVSLQPLSHFALALIAVEVGSHLNIQRLRNAGRRLTLLLLFELTLMPAIVFGALALGTPLGWGGIEMGLAIAALMAALAIETSPATTVHLVRETKSRGVLTKTLLASVALSNIACIFVFELARAGTLSAMADNVGVAGIFAGAFTSLATSLAVGGAIGLGLVWMSRSTGRADALVTIALIGVILCDGIAGALGASPLLACLALGFVQTNLLPAREKLIDSVLANFLPSMMAVFFTLAGMKLDPGVLVTGGLIAGVLFVARAGAKLLVARTAMVMAQAPDKLRNLLGMSRLPQAGVTIGLLLTLQEDPAFDAVESLLVAVVLAVVMLNEIVGPILTRVALKRSGEADMDRTRLIDFLGEENIVTGLEAETVEDAIERLTERLVSSHQLPQSTLEPLLASTLEREAQVSTVLGSGLAIPHGTLDEGERMLGVMGLSRKGLALGAPDGKPVHCIVLLATPRGQRERHLEVLATLARMIGTDPTFAQELFTADTPAHAYELLHGEESGDFNYFLDDEE